MNDNRRGYLIPALLATFAAAGCEPAEEPPESTDPNAIPHSALAPELETVPGAYASTFSTDLMPISVVLDNGLRAEGVGVTSIQQILRLSTISAGEVMVANCAGEQLPFPIYLKESLATAEQSARIECDAAPTTTATGDRLTWRSQCEHGYVLLEMNKLPQSEADLGLTFDLGTDVERYTETSQGCLETFNFDGINNFYRDGALLTALPVTTSHLSLTLPTNNGTLELEFVMSGHFRATAYSWGEPIDPDSAEGDRFQLHLSGEHPWALNEITGGSLTTRFDGDSFAMEFSAQLHHAPPISGNIRTGLINP